MDSRADLDATALAARTLKNFRTDIFGGAIRRAGLEYISAVKTPPEFDYVSYSGSGTMYGITEFADVSDPPRKYLQLESNYGFFGRADSVFGQHTFYVGALNFAFFDAADGSKDLNESFSLGDVWTAGTGVLLPAHSSFEFFDYSSWTEWSPYAPTWTRSKRTKYFLNADLPASPNESGREMWPYGQAFNRIGGIVGSSRGFAITSVTWATGHWQVAIRFACETPTFGSSSISAWMRLAAGNTDPGDVTTSDIPLGSASGTGSFAVVTLTLSLPPDVSVRFGVKNSGDTAVVQVPQPISAKDVNGVISDSGVSGSYFDKWFHFPADDSFPAWSYEEALSKEDTMEAALVRASVTPGTQSIAETTAYSGGTSAESETAIDFTATTVRATRTLDGLTSGHRYNWFPVFRDNTIGMTDFSDVDGDTDEFVASGSSQSVNFLMAAPLGKQRRAVSVTVTDLGPEPAPPSQYQPETILWWGNVLAAGGTLTANSLALADDLVVALKALSSFSSIRYLLPFLGSNLAAALVPLIDVSRYGSPTNNNFVSGDFSESSGLSGNGSNKYLVLPFSPAGFASSNNLGIGFWELDASAVTGTRVAYGAFQVGLASNYFAFRQATSVVDYYSDTTLHPAHATSTPPSNGFWYGERASSTSLKLYYAGSAIATDSNVNSTGLTSLASNLFALNDGGSPANYWPGRMGSFVAVSGSLGDAQVAQLNTIISDFLTAAGRI